MIDIKANIRLVELTARYSQILDVSRFSDNRIQSIQLAPLVSYTILHSIKLYYIRYIELFWSYPNFCMQKYVEFDAVLDITVEYENEFWWNDATFFSVLNAVTNGNGSGYISS